MIDANWHNIEQIAESLLNKGEISGSEMLGLIEKWPKKAFYYDADGQRHEMILERNDTSDIEIR